MHKHKFVLSAYVLIQKVLRDKESYELSPSDLLAQTVDLAKVFLKRITQTLVDSCCAPNCCFRACPHFNLSQIIKQAM